MKPSFSIVTLGCKTNQFESTAMAEKLLQTSIDLTADWLVEFKVQK